MSDYQVSRATTLSRFLSRQNIQAWRIPILITNNAVLVSRRRTRVLPLVPQTRLMANDLVRIIEPLPSAASTALARAVATQAKDLSFIPGTSPFDEQYKNVMRARPSTHLISDRSIASLSDFVRALGQSTEISSPIRHLLIHSHANDEGLLFIQLATGNSREIVYEDLEEASRTGRIRIASEYLEPRPLDQSGNTIAPEIMIRGCRIGLAVPFLRQLKTALGGQFNVSAPKYFMAVAQYTRPAGYLEYLAYGFTITSKTRIRTKSLALRAFAAGGFTRYDGSSVTHQNLSRWIPRNIRRTQRVTTRVISPISGSLGCRNSGSFA